MIDVSQIALQRAGVTGAGLSAASPGASGTAPPSATSDAATAARKFEALLARELLRAMRTTVPDEGFGTGSSFGRETLTAMLDDRLADAVAGRLGLSNGRAAQLDPGARPAAAGLYRTRDAGTPVRAMGPRRSGPISTGLAGPAASRLPPADGPVSSPFGRRIHPITRKRSFHEGVDIAAPEGAEIRALRAGTVVRAGPMGSYGLTVEIDHGDGTRTRYAHASRLHVRKGDRVDAGEGVADVGATGRATGPHLHLEVLRGDRPVDPMPILESLGLSPRLVPGEKEPTP